MADREWTADCVADHFEEAFRALRKLPPVKVQGYFNTWPNIVRTSREIAAMEPQPMRVADQTLPSTWELPSFHRDDRPDHPTPKPLDCFGIPMRQHVARGGLCYEPFSGSGAQIMAGEANGRHVYAIEISPAYVDVAVERWQVETGRAAVLDGDGRSFAEVRQERIGTVSATEAA